MWSQWEESTCYPASRSSKQECLPFLIISPWSYQLNTCFPGQLRAVPVIFNTYLLVGAQQQEKNNLRWVTTSTKDVGKHEFIFFLPPLLLQQARLIHASALNPCWYLRQPFPNYCIHSMLTHHSYSTPPDEPLYRVSWLWLRIDEIILSHLLAGSVLEAEHTDTHTKNWGFSLLKKAVLRLRLITIFEAVTRVTTE